MNNLNDKSLTAEQRLWAHQGESDAGEYQTVYRRWRLLVAAMRSVLAERDNQVIIPATPERRQV